MKYLDVVAALQRYFAQRGLHNLGSAASVHNFAHGEQRTFLVLDLSVSRALLTAPAFTAINAFHNGLASLEGHGSTQGVLRHFFDQGPLFREGAAHHATKRDMKRLLDRQCPRLVELAPRLESLVGGRAHRIRHALDYAQLLVSLSLALLVAELLAVPLPAALRAVRRRANVFYYHFHAPRVVRMDAALARLRRTAVHGGPLDENAWLLAQSLITMGQDPLVGALCAALVDPDCTDFADAPQRYCPTAFVMRRCVEDVNCAGVRFRQGDICYVSLLPAGDEAAAPATFPFGLGTHTCIGKRISYRILALGQEIAARVFPDGFSRPLAVRADGAFLGFAVI